MTTAETGGTISQEVFDSTYDPNILLGIPALSAELQETSLRPYEDDAFFSDRLRSRSRVFRRDPDAAPFIGETLERSDDASIITAAAMLDEALASGTSGREPAVATILSYLTLIQGIEDIHDERLGQAAPNDRANALAQLVARNMNLRIPDNRVSEFMLSNEFLLQRLQEAKLDRSIDKRYMSVKLRVFQDTLTSRALGMAYADAIPAQDQEAVAAETIEGESAAIAEQFNQIMAAQQYGMKLAYKRHYLGGSMIFNEPATLEDVTLTQPDNVHPLTITSPAVAELTHSRLKSFQKLKRQENRILEGDGIGMTYGKIGTISIFYVDSRGELFVDRFCNHSVRDIFVAQQKYGAYRSLQADVLASYFDLTQPAKLVNRVKRDIPTAAAAPTMHETPDEVIRRLLLPRVRALAESAPETEAETVPEETEGPTRSLRYHGVTWHRRQLPEGWSPSPQALELARAARITLKPGETFVKAHHRGSKRIGEVVAHHIVEAS